MSQKNGAYTVDAKQIFSGEKKEIEFSFDIPQEDCRFPDVELITPIKASGSVCRRAAGSLKSEGYVELFLCVGAEISTGCARCLSEVRKRLEFSHTYGLTGTKVDEDSEDFMTCENGVVDVYEAARSMFVLNMPMRFLCKEDCLGLCSSCGKNLNEGECGCTEKETDPRLAVLKNLKLD